MFDPMKPQTWVEQPKAQGKESRLWRVCRNCEPGEWHFVRTLDGHCYTCAYDAANELYWNNREQDSHND